jgi:O-antigen ligase
MKVADRKARTMILVKSPTDFVAASKSRRAEPARDDHQATSRGSHGLAYGGLYLFTLLLYVRPNELFPGVFGSFPIAKIVAISTLLAYAVSKLSSGERLTDWPLELKMVLSIVLLGVVFIPAAQVPKDSIDVLTDTYTKVVIIFILFINLVDTRKRLFKLMKLVVICGTWIAFDAIQRYRMGAFTLENKRIEGIVGGMFGGPNDLATSFALLLPLAVVLMLISKGVMRLVYLVCMVVFTAGIVVTFSRGGFLGLAVAGTLMLWKLARANRAMTLGAATLILALFIVAMPSGYGSRISSISSQKLDKTGSSWERQELLKRAFDVAIHHPIVGIGMGNFHVYSLGEKVAHNSYLEIWCELGLLGLGAYLVLIFAPFRSLRRIETEALSSQDPAPTEESPERNFYLLSVGFQAALAAYIVCSFFGSIQYLWHIYYLAGYAMALSGIWAKEKVVMSEVSSLAEGQREPLRAGNAGGVLWKSSRLRNEYRVSRSARC